MKMKPGTFTVIKAAVYAMQSLFPSAKADYLHSGKSEMRYRWDLYHAACDRNLIDPGLVYREGLNDEHIDTALRAITGTK